jgi:hypothetical protein
MMFNHEAAIMVNLWKLLLAVAAAVMVLIFVVILSIEALKLTALVWCGGGTAEIVRVSQTLALQATCTDAAGTVMPVNWLLVVVSNWIVYFVVIFIALLPFKINLPEPIVSAQEATDPALRAKLFELREALMLKLITPEEFQQRRQELLDNFTKHPSTG